MMKNSLCVVGLCLLLKNSVAYCPVESTRFDKMRLFLHQTIQRPSLSEWREMSEEDKREWESAYQNDPTALMTTEQNREYIAILDTILMSTPTLPRSGGSYRISEEKRAEIVALQAEICGRLQRACSQR